MSFWDGLGVEFKAKYIFDFKGAPRERGPGSVRDGGTEKGPGMGGHKRAPGVRRVGLNIWGGPPHT